MCAARPIRGRCLICCLLVATCLAQKTPPAEHLTAPRPGIVDIRNDPAFRVLLQNPAVRISSLEVGSRGTTLLDQHLHDYLLVSLGVSDLQVSGYGSTYALPMQDGEMQVMKGGWPHRITNLSSSPARLVQVEITRAIHPEHPVCGLGSAQCTGMAFGRTAEGEYSESLLFETDTTRVLRVELGPGGTLLTHHDRRDHILVPLGNSRVEVDGAEQPANQPVWQARGFGQLRNVGAEPLKGIVIELK